MAMFERAGRIAKLTFFVGLAAAAALVDACGSTTESRGPATGGGAGAPGGTGGAPGTGGTSATGGTPATGGTAGTGGVPATGGVAGIDGGVIVDAAPQDAQLWDVIYE
jgi:hypothetical protein